jgi:hypothetical protein
VAKVIKERSGKTEDEFLPASVFRLPEEYAQAAECEKYFLHPA